MFRLWVLGHKEGRFSGVGSLMFRRMTPPDPITIVQGQQPGLGLGFFGFQGSECCCFFRVSGSKV